MTPPLGPRGLAVALCLVCATAMGGLWYARSTAKADPAKLLRRLPVNVEAVVAIDVAALRQAGILAAIAGSDTVEEPDYRQFVEFTGFDYRSDLDYLIAGFDSVGTYFLASGDFDWPALFQYASLQGGVCNHGFCRMPSGTRNRRVSFFPERSSVLALAAGTDEWQASMLYDEREWKRQSPPKAPVWAYLSPRFFVANFDPGSAGALSAEFLKGGKEAWLAAQARDMALELRLEVSCQNPAAAAAMRDRFQTMSAEIHHQIAREVKPANLAEVLAAGQFSATGSTMTGIWRLEPALLELLRGGRL